MIAATLDGPFRSALSWCEYRRYDSPEDAEAKPISEP